MIGRIATYVGRNHVALLALFFALGGTSYAASTALAPKNSVGSAQVINGSLQKGDLSKKAVVALKGNRGLQGAQGAQGAQGPQGAAGSAGPVGAIGRTGSAGAAGAVGAIGPPGISGYVVVSVVQLVANGAFVSLSAPCPAGKTVLGGGFTMRDLQIFVSKPDGTGTAWRVDAQNSSGFNVNLTTYAVCAFVS